jgi:hypothetical protein
MRSNELDEAIEFINNDKINHNFMDDVKYLKIIQREFYTRLKANLRSARNLIRLVSKENLVRLLAEKVKLPKRDYTFRIALEFLKMLCLGEKATLKLLFKVGVVDIFTGLICQSEIDFKVLEISCSSLGFIIHGLKYTLSHKNRIRSRFIIQRIKLIYDKKALLYASKSLSQKILFLLLQLQVLASKTDGEIIKMIVDLSIDISKDFSPLSHYTSKILSNANQVISKTVLFDRFTVAKILDLLLNSWSRMKCSLLNEYLRVLKGIIRFYIHKTHEMEMFIDKIVSLSFKILAKYPFSSNNALFWNIPIQSALDLLKLASENVKLNFRYFEIDSPELIFFLKCRRIDSSNCTKNLQVFNLILLLCNNQLLLKNEEYVKFIMIDLDFASKFNEILPKMDSFGDSLDFQYFMNSTCDLLPNSETSHYLKDIIDQTFFRFINSERFRKVKNPRIESIKQVKQWTHQDLCSTKILTLRNAWNRFKMQKSCKIMNREVDHCLKHLIDLDQDLSGLNQAIKSKSILPYVFSGLDIIKPNNTSIIITSITTILSIIILLNL